MELLFVDIDCIGDNIPKNKYQQKVYMETDIPFPQAQQFRSG